jgi:hypothetical protein
MASIDHPCSAGGDDVAHSSVSPPHGFFPAGAPSRTLRITFQMGLASPETLDMSCQIPACAAGELKRGMDRTGSGSERARCEPAATGELHVVGPTYPTST